MAIEFPSALNSFGSVKGSDGTKVSGAGFTPGRTGKGAYTLTLDQPVEAGRCALLATPRGAAPLELAIAQTSASVKTIAVLDNAGAAQDTDFDFVCYQGPF